MRPIRFPRPLLTLLACVVAAAVLAGAASAQDDAIYPSKPIRVVVGFFAAGGGNDLVARIVGPRLSEIVGQPVIVENRPGAAGQLAVTYVQSRPAYTILVGATAELRPEGVTSLLHIGVHAGFDVDGLRTRLTQFRQAQPQVAIRLSQPAGLHELLDGKVDVVIAERLRRYPGYRCEPLESGFLIGPLGTADCPEIETLRSCLVGHVELEPATTT